MGRASRTKRERRSVRVLYHYTSVAHLRAIEAAGYIDTTESNVSFSRTGAGPDVVWLLDTPSADEYDHGLAGSVIDKRSVRITVRTTAEMWSEWVKRQNSDELTRTSLVNAAGGPEAAKHWWVTERRIPRAEWVAVEVSK